MLSPPGETSSTYIMAITFREFTYEHWSLDSHRMFPFSPDRLVECSALKRAMEIVYAATLPKASKPFIYMSIVLPSEHVDVNIHPTKREVRIFCDYFMKLIIAYIDMLNTVICTD